MSGIAGLIHLDGAPVERSHLESMVSAQSPRASAGFRIWTEGPVGLAQLWSRHDPLEAVGPGGTRVVGDARIDNRAEVAAAIGGRPGWSDLQLIASAFERWGSSAPERLHGDLAVAIWDPRGRRLRCIRDRFGTKPLVVHRSATRFAFASQPAGILALPGLQTQIDEVSVGAFLVDEIPDETSTFFRGIDRLAPAHLIEVQGDGRVSSPTRYWALDPNGGSLRASDREYEERFRELLTDAVRSRLHDADRPAVALSGGVDSSTVASLAGGVGARDATVRTYTVGTTDPRRDERTFVEAVLATGHFEPVFIQDRDVVDSVPARMASVSIDSPYAAVGALIDGELYRRASLDGVDVVLDGVDGDTVVSHGIARLTDLAIDGHLLTLWRESRALAGRLGWTTIGTLRAQVVSPLLPHRPERSFSDSLISAEFAGRIGLRDRLGARPRRPDRPRARGEHLLDLSAPVNALALETLEHTATIMGVEVRHPFFEARLAEFCLGLPADQKLRDGWPRSILRRSMAGTVPDVVRWRPDKAVLGPSIAGRCVARAWPAVTDLVGHGGGRAAPYVDRNALRRAYERCSAQGGVDAGLLWDVLLLDRWLRETA